MPASSPIGRNGSMYTLICRNCAKTRVCTQEISNIAHIFAARGRPNCYKDCCHDGQWF